MSEVRVSIDTREFEKKLSDYLDSNSETIAKEIARDARANPGFKDVSGKLRKSIRARKSRYEWGGWIVIMGGKGARQAYIIEKGRDAGPGKSKAPAFKTLGNAKDRAINRAKELFGVR